MQRIFAFVAAVVIAVIAVSSAGFASGSTDNLSFTLRPGAPGTMQLALYERGDGHRHSMSSGFPEAALAGLDASMIRSGGSGNIQFALVREPGRIDCSGSSRDRQAKGACRFTPDAGFSDFLVSRGIARPSREKSYELTMVEANRALVDAVRAAPYPAPTLERLVELAALDVTPEYIHALKSRGMLPSSTSRLVEFAALRVDPAYVDGLAQAGYRNLPVDQLVELRALDVSPEYVAELARAGYTGLSADDLTQLKALGVDAEYIAGFQAIGYRNLSPDRLVELKALGVTPDFVTRVRKGGALPDPDRLVEMKALGFIR